MLRRSHVSRSKVHPSLFFGGHSGLRGGRGSAAAPHRSGGGDGGGGPRPGKGYAADRSGGGGRRGSSFGSGDSGAVSHAGPPSLRDASAKAEPTRRNVLADIPFAFSVSLLPEPCIKAVTAASPVTVLDATHPSQLGHDPGIRSEIFRLGQQAETELMKSAVRDLDERATTVQHLEKGRATWSAEDFASQRQLLRRMEYYEEVLEQLQMWLLTALRQRGVPEVLLAVGGRAGSPHPPPLLPGSSYPSPCQRHGFSAGDTTARVQSPSQRQDPSQGSSVFYRFSDLGTVVSSDRIMPGDTVLLRETAKRMPPAVGPSSSSSSHGGPNATATAASGAVRSAAAAPAESLPAADDDSADTTRPMPAVYAWQRGAVRAVDQKGERGADASMVVAIKPQVAPSGSSTSSDAKQRPTAPGAGGSWPCSFSEEKEKLPDLRDTKITSNNQQPPVHQDALTGPSGGPAISSPPPPLPAGGEDFDLVFAHSTAAYSRLHAAIDRGMLIDETLAAAPRVTVAWGSVDWVHTAAAAPHYPMVGGRSMAQADTTLESTRKLDPSQLAYLRAVVGPKDAATVYLPCHVLHGPPGTGKTGTMAAAIAQLVVDHPKARVLVCEPTNAAMLAMLEALDKTGAFHCAELGSLSAKQLFDQKQQELQKDGDTSKGLPAVRRGSTQPLLCIVASVLRVASAAPIVRRYAAPFIAGDRFSLPERGTVRMAAFRSARVVVCTLGTAGELARESFTPHLQQQQQQQQRSGSSSSGKRRGGGGGSTFHDERRGGNGPQPSEPQQGTKGMREDVDDASMQGIFTHVAVDEAGFMTEPQWMQASRFLNWRFFVNDRSGGASALMSVDQKRSRKHTPTVMLLAGDHKQLGPVFKLSRTNVTNSRNRVMALPFDRMIAESEHRENNNTSSKGGAADGGAGTSTVGGGEAPSPPSSSSPTSDDLFLDGLHLGEDDPYAQMLSDAVVRLKYNYRSKPGIVKVFSDIFYSSNVHTPLLLSEAPPSLGQEAKDASSSSSSSSAWNALDAQLGDALHRRANSSSSGGNGARRHVPPPAQVLSPAQAAAASHATMWLDVPFGVPLRSGDTRSFYNPEEADIVAQLCTELLLLRGTHPHHASGVYGGDLRPSDIGVVTPYTLQKRCILRALQRARLAWRQQQEQRLGDQQRQEPRSPHAAAVAAAAASRLQEPIEVESIERFQGRQKKVIIVSTVRSATTAGGNVGDIGFVDCPRRANVSISRASHRNIIVGNAAFLSERSVPWRAIAEHHRRGGLLFAARGLQRGSPSSGSSSGGGGGQALPGPLGRPPHPPPPRPPVAPPTAPPPPPPTAPSRSSASPICY